MITTDELAQNLANYYINAPYKEHAINHILIEMNCLHQAGSKERLSYDVKYAIVQLLQMYLIRDTRSFNAFQQLKPTLLKKLEDCNDTKKKNKVSVVATCFKELRFFIQPFLHSS